MAPPHGVTARTLRRLIGSLELQNFAGGLNLRDSPLELAPNETPFAFNMTIDERGGVSKRLGSALATIPKTANDYPIYLYEDPNGSGFFVGTSGGNLYYYAGGSWTLNAGPGVPVGPITKFKGLYYMATSSGFYQVFFFAPPVLINATVQGLSIATWQNKVWVGSSSAGNPPRIWWCNAGDPTTWTTVSDFVDVREGNDDFITGLGGQPGMDILGRGGLLVFKRKSVHRINNSTTGAYTTLSLQAGSYPAAGGNTSLGLLATRGLATYHVNEVGIWETGINTDPVLISAKVGPLFGLTAAGQLQLAPQGATIVGNRLYVSACPVGWESPVVSKLLEFHLDEGWTMVHTFPYDIRGQLLQVGGLLYAGARDLAHTKFAVAQLLTGGVDTDPASTTTHIPSTFRTRHFLPAGGRKVMPQRLRVTGRGQFNVAEIRDYALAADAARAMSISTASAVLGLVDEQSFQAARAIAFEFTGANADDTTYTIPALAGLADSRTGGGWALAGAQLEYAILLNE